MDQKISLLPQNKNLLQKGGESTGKFLVTFKNILS